MAETTTNTERRKARLCLTAAVWAGMVAAFFAGGLSGLAAEKPIRVLLFSGQNNHDWNTTTPKLKSILGDSGRFSVVVNERPDQCTAETFARCDVIVSDWNAWGKVPVTSWPPATRQAFLNFIRNGGGHVAVHAGASSFYDWPEYQQIGGAWWDLAKTNHGAPHEFTVQSDAEHPITRGMPPFKTKDELWMKPGIHAAAKVIATADGQPLAVTTEFGKGRGFAMLLGHAALFMDPPGFQTLLLHGTEWAATGKVSAASDAASDRDALRADMQFFTDPSCSQLKASVGPKELATFKSDLLRTLAAGLLDGKYDKTCRAAGYDAYPSAGELGRTLKLGNNFSRYENITGMYLEAGRHVVFVGNTGGKRLSLLIPDWMRKPPEGINPTKDPKGWGLYKQEVRLNEGANVIQVEKSGNAYVSYFDDQAEQAPKVTVHFPTGKVNGFFDASKQTDADWDRLLDHAVSPIMDARGKHIQVAYPVEWFNVYTRGKGVELINNYDAMLNHHYSLMGLVKYNKVPKNRILARVNFNYYMFRDSDGVAYLGNKGTMRMVADPSVVIKGDPCWGFCHEVGHALQMRQITWGGMTEVSNNLFSLYTGGKMGNGSRIKAQGNYASARKKIIEANPKKSFLDGTDVFDRLVPFWQLHLYFSRNGQPDFYADVMEEMRRRPDAGSGDNAIRNQFEFVKICCDVSKLDLTDFFDKWGFFWVGELTVGDYGRHHYKIAQQMVDEVKSSIAKKQYKKPAVDVTLIED